jgi:hypothetical protein
VCVWGVGGWHFSSHGPFVTQLLLNFCELLLHGVFNSDCLQTSASTITAGSDALAATDCYPQTSASFLGVACAEKDEAIFVTDSGQMQVRESDLLVVAAKAEEEAASLEVWLFEDADAEGERNAYVHHDIPLPAFPLAVTWMRFNPHGSCFQISRLCLRVCMMLMPWNIHLCVQ